MRHPVPCVKYGTVPVPFSQQGWAIIVSATTHPLCDLDQSSLMDTPALHSCRTGVIWYVSQCFNTATCPWFSAACCQHLQRASPCVCADPRAEAGCVKFCTVTRSLRPSVVAQGPQSQQASSGHSAEQFSRSRVPAGSHTAPINAASAAHSDICWCWRLSAQLPQHSHQGQHFGEGC